MRVNCIAPGLIKTDFAKALWDNPETLERSTKGVPLRRIGEPDELAGAAVYLASKAGSFMDRPGPGGGRRGHHLGGARDVGRTTRKRRYFPRQSDLGTERRAVRDLNFGYRPFSYLAGVHQETKACGATSCSSRRSQPC